MLFQIPKRILPVSYAEAQTEYNEKPSSSQSSEHYEVAASAPTVTRNAALLFTLHQNNGDPCCNAHKNGKRKTDTANFLSNGNIAVEKPICYEKHMGSKFGCLAQNIFVLQDHKRLPARFFARITGALNSRLTFA